MLKHPRTARRNSCCCCAVCCIRVKHASSVYAPTANYDPLFPLFFWQSMLGRSSMFLLNANEPGSIRKF
uniref:Putative secreted protein n=1 Tax=Anopheles marajoara TaxID=58244 RepID=A0A2M4CEY7_9DIPT